MILLHSKQERTISIVQHFLAYLHNKEVYSSAPPKHIVVILYLFIILNQIDKEKCTKCCANTTGVIVRLL